MFGVRTSAQALGLALLASLGVQAHAATLSTDNNPSLILFIWDPVNKVSYSRDTGLTGATLYSGLSDAGSQQFWTLDPSTDTNFAKFVQASTNLSQDEWMVIGAGKANLGSGPGSSAVFTTLINTVLQDDQPTLNPEWPNFTTITNTNMRGKAGLFAANMYAQLTNGNNTTYNNYATAPSGTASSFDASSSSAYFGNMTSVFSDPTGYTSGDQLFANGGAGFDIGNTLGSSGSSSWFYYMTPSSTSSKSSALISVSAFANSQEDAYWGLARTTDTSGQQELVLSFTLPSAITQTTTALGAVRRVQTDYAAQYGIAAPVVNPRGEFSGWTPSTLLDEPVAVPEPASNMLMLLGLGGVFAAARRARRKRA